MLLVSELAERLANELLERGDGIRDPCESALGYSLAEAQAGERMNGFRTRIGNSRADGAAVGRAVGMGETELRAGRA